MPPIAIYHCSIKIISRGKGKSAVAAAAYRAGEKIISDYDGRINDYTRKGGIVHKEIMLPDKAPAEYQDRAVLWNAVEKIEKSSNSQLAREIEIALPVELNYMQNLNLVREYVRENFVAHGMVADFAIHDPKGETKNPHAHIMLTMRPFNENKAWGSKQKKEYILDPNGEKQYDPKKRSYKCKSIPSTDWNEQTKAEEWRSAWADILNSYLEQTGHAEKVIHSPDGELITISNKVDHRSFERQGITDQIPTIHLGVAAHQMEQRGIKTERGNINREIMVTNNLLRQLKARISKIEKWIEEERNTPEVPTLADVISDILNRREQTGQQSRYGAINNLKQVADMLNFLQENKIMDLDGLHKHIIAMHNKQSAIRDKLIPKERRLKALAEHIKQADLYFEHRAIYKMYKAEKPKHQEQFYESNRAPLTLYESAERYLKGVMNCKTKIPTGAWKKEYADLTAERQQLNAEYNTLKNEVGKVEKISRSVQDILYAERQRTQPQKEQPSRKRSYDIDR